MSTTPKDFDFIIGHWDVSHRRLKARLAGCSEWESFPGVSSTQKVLGGFGNLEDNVLEAPAGSYAAVALRSFDPKDRVWSIWWLDARYPRAVETPVVGRFDGEGIGTFFADDTLDGRPIRVRFIWTATDPALPRWEQAFSADGGLSWETNWTMEFRRRAAP